MSHKYFIVFITFYSLFFFNTLHCSAETDEVIVGFYEDEPYYFFDEKGEVQGYYHDLMQIISEKLNIDFVYDYLTIEECFEKLENREIDLLFGVAKTEERGEVFEFSKYRIHNLENSIYSNHNIEFGNLAAMEGLVLGYIPNLHNHQSFLQILEHEEIDCLLKPADSSVKLKEWLSSKEIDFMLTNSYDESMKPFYQIYTFSSGAAYLITYKENRQLMNEINHVFDEMSDSHPNEIKLTYNKYFNRPLLYAKETFNVMGLALLLGGVIYLIYQIILNSQRKKKYNEYLYYLKTECFKIFYQPIVNPENEHYIGFEALIRLVTPTNILSPQDFIQEIEELDFMYQVTLWMIEKTILDYPIFQQIHHVKDLNYYISINLSYKELLDSRFLEDIKRILTKYQDFNYTLCFEIVEKFPMTDITLIQNQMAKLKSLGIKFAMDDFGVKYANFDILEKVDFDVVKLDKIFIEECIGSSQKQEILKCILTIIKLKQKKVVIEGVEVIEEVNIIKALADTEVYIQGYYYSRPLPLQELIK